MKRNRRQHDPGRLEPLAAQAADYALHVMRTTGSVPPTANSDTANRSSKNWKSVLELGRMPRDEEFDRLADVRQACGSLPRALQLFIDRFGAPTFAAARQSRKEDLLVFVAAAQLRSKIPFNQLSLRLQRDLRSFFGSYANAEEKARDLMFAAGDEDELEIAVGQLDFGHLDAREGHFTIHRSLLRSRRPSSWRHENGLR